MTADQEMRLWKAKYQGSQQEVDTLTVENKRLQIEIELLELKKPLVLVNNG